MKKALIQFVAEVKKFGEQGEKTGWTYIDIPSSIAQQLKPNHKTSFRVKGNLDGHPIEGVALVPMGEGHFILALNADLRRATGLRKGATTKVELEEDIKPYQLNSQLMECLADEPKALEYFQSLPMAHQRYFSKWIESAKTAPTRDKRIAMAVSALARQWGYPEMLRGHKAGLI